MCSFRSACTRSLSRRALSTSNRNTTAGALLIAISCALGPDNPDARKVRARLSSACRLLHVPAELVAHGGKELVAERRLAARAEALVERGRKHRRRHGLVDCGFDRPASFARVGDAAGKALERGILDQRSCNEVEQP